MSEQQMHSHFITQARELLGVEYRTKLRHAVAMLPEHAVWQRANEGSNSVGNLLLHLAGNIRQWIVGGVGRQANARNRAAEFAATAGASKAELMADLERAIDEVDAVLAGVTAATLLEPRTIQSRDITVLNAIFHVVEHFSYHLGQIVLIAKAHAPGTIAFYEDAGGQARPSWKDLIKS